MTELEASSPMPVLERTLSLLEPATSQPAGKNKRKKDAPKKNPAPTKAPRKRSSKKVLKDLVKKLEDELEEGEVPPEPRTQEPTPDRLSESQPL